MRFIYGTTNAGKVEQVKDFFKTQKGIMLDILSLKDIGFTEDIIEDGETFEENSKIKAQAIRQFCRQRHIKETIITDDAGLCVDALKGEPGVKSARYAGDHAPQEIALKKLLTNMKNVPEEKRTAHFVCVLTVVLSDDTTFQVKGVSEGKIAEKPGTMGKLTYGPVFIPEGSTVVMNEMSDEDLGTTHREKAFMQAIERMRQLEEKEECKY